jgi:hypothetical protein
MLGRSYPFETVQSPGKDNGSPWKPESSYKSSALLAVSVNIYLFVVLFNDAFLVT